MISGARFRHLTDRTWKQVIILCSVSSFLILLLIALFTFREGWPAFSEIGLFKFLSGTTWSVSADEFGILPMIVGTAYVTVLALLMSVPLGVACAVFLAEVAPKRVRDIFRPAIELLVGIPSVVYGLVGLMVIVPLIGKLGGSGDSVLAAAIVLTVMVLPTIISISEDSIRAVPHGYKEGALALGATPWQVMWGVTLPAARSGILASIILGMGRAIGETMAMIMVIGNSIIIPDSPLSPARTLTGTLALELKYAAGLHWDALFATGVVLFAFILILNSFALILRRKEIR
ncbi:MAG: phosphate ABC transporter permease subunit PstC [Dehalococcoidia bacterium]|jgi:phosphate transport system permease protein